ncbi:MFS transporter [Moraxella catarrhalis]|uniref:MFS transporter n=1 Tax=Moraxella catarrhalis TaxID=480 RepID=UPI0007E4A64F|nr:MFS transporter [Moraxella catarrhalis]OAV04255.1 MFS transporter [Moraxella catarrhalis]OAV07104.1 MFS transporter [Moraxella catarrhalis]OAV13485.1 MFS transporter [Moraxella catarrhalis]OAV19021.1 MFS transporter [Moraxella catarrhalis]OAV19357.1 MFS transporter [Moraxella catarrhalis]
MTTLRSRLPTLSEKFTIAMIGFFAFLQVYSVQAILPVLMTDLKATEVQAGMAVGATVLAIALISPFMGMMSDAVGRKPFIVSSLLMLALPTALIGMASSIYEVIFWRFLQGVSVPGITVVLIAYISEEYSSKLATMMSLYVSGTVLGGFSGRFFAGYLEHFIGWRYGYTVMAICTLIGAIWAYKSLPRSQNFIISENFRTTFATLFSHTKNLHVICSGFLGACVLFSLVGCFTFINLHLSESPYLLTPADLANIFAIYLIGMVITPLSTRVVIRFGMTSTILLAILVSITGLLMTLFMPLGIVIMGLTLMSSGVFITQSATISYLTSHVSEGRSLASGLYYMGYYGGGFIGAWACALAYAQGKWLWTVGLILVVQLIALGVVTLFMRKHA